jgi:phosphoserine phosphatase
MLRIVLVRPGCTDFDLQGRMKGSLDIPLCETGTFEASRLIEQLREYRFSAVYTAPCQSALQTAKILASQYRIKPKLVEELRNVDHGLWHGKLVEEVKQTQPKVYRLGQEYGESICPPGGEPIAASRERVATWLQSLLKKNNGQCICCVVPEPLATILACEIANRQLEDLWDAECDHAQWQVFDVESQATQTIFRGIHHGAHTCREVRELNTAISTSITH